MNASKITYIILALSCFSLLLSCQRKAAQETVVPTEQTTEEQTIAFTSAQYKTAGIELGRVEMRSLSGTIKVNGKLDVPPQQMVSVSVPLGGFLKNTSLLQGSRVKKGELIATLENLDFIQLQQDYIEAANQLEFAKADYDRQLDLSKENINAVKTLQLAQTTYRSWEAKANGLYEKLKLLNIDVTALKDGKISSSINLYSPIDGYVTRVNVNIGKFVNSTDVLFEIVNTEHLHAELTVFEKDVPKLKIGQKVRFTLANETKERTAVVYLLGREIAADRTVRIHCHIDKEDSNLLPGMFLKAFVETGGVNVPALPDDAIIDYQGAKYIFYPLTDSSGSKQQEGRANRFKMLEINVGNHELGYTEVILPDNFPVGTPIVVKNAYAILSKLKNVEEED